MNRLFLLIICLVLTSCHYSPFVEYMMSKKSFKKFDENEKLAGDNNSPDRQYHINHYDWQVKVFPEKKKIDGVMTITFTPLETRSRFLFDMQAKLKIQHISSNIGAVKTQRKGDLLYVDFENEVTKGTSLTLTIDYKGKPVNVAGEGPIQWKKDEKDRPWVSTLTQGIGPHFMMPCSALLQKEPDSVKISVTVPNELEAVANGQRIQVIENENATATYVYEVKNPINIYSLSFNIGHFKTISKSHSDIEGFEHKLQFSVLDYNYAVADSFYNQTSEILSALENMYGPFPFWQDGCNFVESTFGAMEHQSAIAMGTPYKDKWKEHNLTLIHEIAHEWWGNSVTAFDYCDAWLHEGFATYSEALVVEKLYGRQAYNERLLRSIRVSRNKFPVRKRCDVLYNSWVNNADYDIYDKGALILHSLRIVVNNDDLFFSTLRNIQNDYKYKHLTSDQFEQIWEKATGLDLTSFFDQYLDKAEPPILLYKKVEGKSGFEYRWKKEAEFLKNGKVTFVTSGDTLTIEPTETYQFFETKKDSSASMLVSESIYFLLTPDKEVKK